MQKLILYFCVAIISLYLISCGAPKTKLSVLRPSEIDMSANRSIAIADFTGNGNSGKIVATKLAAALFESDYFKIMERSRIQEVLSEQSLGLTGAMDPASAAELGKVLGVEALIFGEVASYRMDDESGTEKVSRQVWTGEYERDKDGNILYEQTIFGKIKKKKYREELVDEPYVVRSGSVQISFRVVDVETAQLLAVKTASADYSKKATGTDEIGVLRPADAILLALTDKAISQFAPLISPYYVIITKQFEKGSERVKQAIKMVQAGLPEKALPIFESELEYNPEAKSFYNLGVCYEILGSYDDAENMYDKAVSMNPSDQHIKALKDIRRSKEDQEILEQRE